MKSTVLYLILIVLLACGCGTTHLVTNNPNVDIYVNNQYKGKGDADITKTGPPKRIKVEARYHGGQVGIVSVKRKVTLVTFVVGLYTYGAGFIFCWSFPDTVFIPTDNTNEQKVNAFDSQESIWNLPPGGWKNK
jgi:hypothetical protein